MGRSARAHAWGLSITLVLVGCGRVGFEAPDGGIDGGPLVLSCAGNEPCSLSCRAAVCTGSCEGSSSCALEADDAERLDFACEASAECWVEADDVEVVAARCAPSSSCDIDCDGVEGCEVACAEGASCELTCSSTAACRLRCEAGAACTLRCPWLRLGTCEIEGCPDGQLTECSSRVSVCGGACP